MWRSETGNVLASRGPNEFLFKGMVFTDPSLANSLPARVALRLYAKGSNQLLDSFEAIKLPGTTTLPSELCGTFRNGEVQATSYLSRPVTLTPAQMTNPGGYYVVSDPIAPRYSALQNAADPNGNPFVFYYEINSLPANLDFSKPEFDYTPALTPTSPVAEWVCKNRPTTLGPAFRNQPFGGATPAGWEVRFRPADLVTARLGGPALPVAWQGFSTSNPFPSSGGITPPATAAAWSFKPAGSGLYVYTLAMDVLKDGRKVGEARWEHVFEVVDNCPDDSKASIFMADAAAPNVEIVGAVCEGKTVQLKAQSSATGLRYQWQLGGADISGANGAVYTTTTPGSYTVVTSRPDACPAESTSPAVAVSFTPCTQAGQVLLKGGQLEDSNVNAEVDRTMYLKATYYTTVTGGSQFPTEIQAGVYRKSDQGRVSTLTLTRSTNLARDVKAYAPLCTGGDSLKVLAVPYQFNFTNFTPLQFADPGGYFIATAPICCRQPLDNLSGAYEPMVLRMDLAQANQLTVTVPNSSYSPTFTLPSLVETCMGKPVTLSNITTRPANFSSLTYLLTPALIPGTGGPSQPAAYANGGYTSTQFWGNPAGGLSIDANTGTITGTPTRPGTYAYVVTVQAKQGNRVVSEIRRELHLVVNECRVNTIPTVKLSETGQPSRPGRNPICKGETVQLNAGNVARGSTLQWQLNGIDIVGATDSVYVVRNDLAGNYSVTANNPVACPVKVRSDFLLLKINELPTVSIQSPANAFCDGSALMLTSQTTTTVPSYQWLRDGQLITSATIAGYSASEPGRYTLRVSDPIGCQGVSAPLNIIRNSLPRTVVTASARAICAGQSVQLSVTAPSPGLAYQWLRDGQPISTATTTAYTATVTGLYTARATDSGTNCAAEASPVNLASSASPTIRISADSTQLCPGSTASLRASDASLTTYQWLFNDVDLSGATAATWITQQAGRYALRVSNAAGCLAMSDTLILSSVTPISVVMQPLGTICGLDQVPVTLLGSPAGGSFSGPGVSGDRFEAKAAGFGTHTVTYTVRNALSCLRGTDRQATTVATVPTVNLGRDRTFSRGGTLRLNGPVAPGYQYTWFPPTDLSDPTRPDPLASPTVTTAYRLRVTNAEGCAAEDTILLRYEQRIYIPTAFSPNNDGLNDAWELPGIEEYPQAEVALYNRWGEEVFRSQNGYLQPFDGRYQGQSLPGGTYIYAIRSAPGEPLLRGSVTILR